MTEVADTADEAAAEVTSTADESVAEVMSTADESVAQVDPHRTMARHDRAASVWRVSPRGSATTRAKRARTRTVAAGVASRESRAGGPGARHYKNGAKKDDDAARPPPQLHSLVGQGEEELGEVRPLRGGQGGLRGRPDGRVRALARDQGGGEIGGAHGLRRFFLCGGGGAPRSRRVFWLSLLRAPFWTGAVDLPNRVNN